VKGLSKVVAWNLLKEDGDNELIRIFNDGLDHRLMRDTDINEASSRSHLLFTINITSWTDTEAFRCSKLTFVDLAGSERVAMINFEEFLYEEALFICESLQCLGRIIYLITKGLEIMDVPYEFNLLTSLLQDSIGGCAKTLMVVTISPSMYDLEATMSTLKFSEQTGLIKN
jgi:hypothetical protein